MREQIYELLKKIDDMKVAKFGVDETNRVFLKRLYLDESYRNEMIDKSGEEEFYAFLQQLYEQFCNIAQNLNELVDMCEETEELRDVFGKDAYSDASANEENKDKEIEGKI